MYLPFRKPDCVSDISESRTFFILKLIHPEIILYNTFKRVIGRQFFKNCLGLSPFGKHEITPSLCEMGSSFLKKIQLIALTTKCFKSFQKKFKKFSSISIASRRFVVFHMFYYSKYLCFHNVFI